MYVWQPGSEHCVRKKERGAVRPDVATYSYLEPVGPAQRTKAVRSGAPIHRPQIVVHGDLSPRGLNPVKNGGLPQANIHVTMIHRAKSWLQHSITTLEKHIVNDGSHERLRAVLTSSAPTRYCTTSPWAKVRFTRVSLRTSSFKKSERILRSCWLVLLNIVVV